MRSRKIICNKIVLLLLLLITNILFFSWLLVAKFLRRKINSELAFRL